MIKKIGPDEIMQMATGFWISKTLFAGLELGIFDALSIEKSDSAQLSKKLGLPKESLERLLSALCALELLVKRGDQYCNSSAAQAHLVKSSPMFIGGNFGHFNNDLYPLWGFLSDAVREDGPRWKQAFGDEVSENPFEALYAYPDRLADFMSAMSSMTIRGAIELLEHFDFSNYRCLLDIGGASGAMAVTVLSRNQNLNAIVFDLPAVGPIAERFIEEAGMRERARFVAGDMFADRFPVDADIISMGWILHDWNDEHSLVLLEKAFEALPSGGSVLIVEKFLNEDKTGPIMATLMSLNMLVASLGGRERTAKEYSDLLEKAGFVDCKSVILPGIRDYIVARKP